VGEVFGIGGTHHAAMVSENEFREPPSKSLHRVLGEVRAQDGAHLDASMGRYHLLADPVASHVFNDEGPMPHVRVEMSGM
jgi:hypothetical protein